jgi:RNA polymerase sigma-70 factor (ECF subfamily)
MDERTASDEALMLALAERAEALDPLYERHGGAALGLAIRMLGERETAEEVVQEAFLSLWRNAQRFDPARGTVRTWLLGIVHNRAIDRLRGRPPTAPLPDDLGADPSRESDVWAQAVQRLDLQEIMQALQQLPTEQRETIELAYFAGLTQAQIAALLRLPLGTVKGRMRLALVRLRTLLQPYVVGES